MIAVQQLAARRIAAAPAGVAWRPVAAPRRAQRSDNSVRCFSNAEGGNIEISFSLPYHCKYGQRLCVIGGSDNLGAWNVAKAVPMEWTEGDVWIVDLRVPANGNAAIEYKYVVRSERDMEAVRWMEGSNLQLRLPTQPGRLRVRDTWDESCREVEVEVEPSLSAPPPPSPPPPAPSPPPPQAVQASAAPPAPQAAQATQAEAASSPRRRRSKKVDEDAELQASISRAADKAMQQLDAAVTRSLDLLGATADPSAPELLAADRLVAAAAKRATTMNRALDAAREVKLLPGNGRSGSGSRSGSGTRRRRAAVAKSDSGSNGAGREGGQ
ncbi:hypothetical protein ABPG75_013430 [Micractinium tetrahymenae]